MRAGRVLGVLAAAGVAVASAVALSNPELRKKIEKRCRYMLGKGEGVVYQMQGRHPDPDVSDDIIADRIRSELGPLEHRLDTPRIHVMVENHVALLHGDVPSDFEAAALIDAVSDVSGVDGVKSFLHIGLLPSDTRPSVGQAHASWSAAHRRLVSTAKSAVDCGDEAADRLVRAVLGGFAGCLPEGERRHLLQHLPEDVRALAKVPKNGAAAEHAVRTPDDLKTLIAEHGRIDRLTADKATDAVLTVVTDLVPEEIMDVAAVLPAELKSYWATRALCNLAPLAR